MPAAGYFLRCPAGAHVGSMAQNRSLESHRLIGRTSYRRTNLWRFLLQLHRHCLFSLSCSCFCPVWRSCSACLRKKGGGSCRVAVRSTEERCYYTYVNGQKIKHVVKPKLGEHQPNNPKLVYTMDFQVTPHQLRHTYITNLIYASVDPKTVQYLAGHENSKVTMDIYAKVKYNKPAQLHGVINRAIDTSKKD